MKAAFCSTTSQSSELAGSTVALTAEGVSGWAFTCGRSWGPASVAAAASQQTGFLHPRSSQAA